MNNSYQEKYVGSEKNNIGVALDYYSSVVTVV